MQHWIKSRKKDWAWERESEKRRERPFKKKEENRLPLLPLSVEKVTFNLKVETFISICRDRSSSRLADAGALCVLGCVCERVCVCACAAWGSSVLGLHDRQTGIRLELGCVHVCFWIYACLCAYSPATGAVIIGVREFPEAGYNSWQATSYSRRSDSTGAIPHKTARNHFRQSVFVLHLDLMSAAAAWRSWVSLIWSSLVLCS